MIMYPKRATCQTRLKVPILRALDEFQSNEDANAKAYRLMERNRHLESARGRITVSRKVRWPEVFQPPQLTQPACRYRGQVNLLGYHHEGCSP